MANKYLEKIAGIGGIGGDLIGVMKPKTVPKLVSSTNKMERAVANRERLNNLGLSNKPINKSTAKLQALRNQSTNRVWKG